MTRLFIAAELPASQLQTLVKAQSILAGAAKRCSLTKAQNLHLTLRFIGEVDESGLERIKQKLAELPLEGLADYRCRITGYDFFWRQAAMLVFAQLTTTPELRQLVASIEQTLVAVGCRAETKDWLTHVTLARRCELKSGQKTIPTLPILSSWGQIPGIYLYQSEFSPRGMVYTPLMALGTKKGQPKPSF